MQKKRWIAALAAALTALALFWPSLPATITGEDAGELTAAAYFLGIPHPPGYPTWCLFAHPFTWIPYGSIAFRVALSSAVFGALAAGVVSLIVSELTATAWAGFVAGVLLAGAVPFYEQSIIAEVYALNTLCFSLCVYFLIRWTADRRDRWLFALALATGLGQGVHNTMTLLAPVFGLYVACNDPRFVLQPRRLLPCLAIFALGCTTYLYLPIRSLANPPVDWGNPENLPNFLAMLRRDQFAFMYSQYPHSFARFVTQLQDAGISSFYSWTIALHVSAAAVFGLAYLLFRPRREYWLLLATGLLPVLIIIWVQNPLQTAEWHEVMVPFYIPGAWLLAIALGILLGAPKLNLRLRQSTATFCVLTVLFFSVPLAAYYRHWERFNEPCWVDAYARNLLNQLPERAILFAGPDHAAFPILYLQTVEHVREDVTLGNPYGYVDVALITDAPESLRNELGPRPRRGLDPKYFTWLLAHTDRPVFFSDIPALEDGASVKFRQEGLLYRALLDPNDPDLMPIWPESYTWPTNDYGMRSSYAPGYTARQIVAEYQLKRLRYQLALGDEELLQLRINNLHSVAWDDPEYLNNAATLLARHGDYQTAKRFLDEALACDPDNATVRANLDKVKAHLDP